MCQRSGVYQKHYCNLCVLEQFFFLKVRICKTEENLSCVMQSNFPSLLSPLPYKGFLGEKKLMKYMNTQANKLINKSQLKACHSDSVWSRGHAPHPGI